MNKFNSYYAKFGPAYCFFWGKLSTKKNHTLAFQNRNYNNSLHVFLPNGKLKDFCKRNRLLVVLLNTIQVKKVGRVLVSLMQD